MALVFQRLDNYQQIIPQQVHSERTLLEQGKGILMKHWVQSADAVACAVSAVAMGGGLWSSSASPVRAATIGSCATLAEERIRVTCATKDKPVRACDPADVKLACQGAHDAIYFLRAQGFNTANRVVIVIAQKLPPAGTASTGGLYLDSPDVCHGDTDQAVHLLTYSEFKKFKNWFHIPMEGSLYRSLAAHEVAHAISDCNFKLARPTIQAKEYLAYVTMFATMAPAVRERILRKSPGHGYEGDWQMGTTIYLADPMRFGVQAYRHFLKPDHGRSYLHAILAGKVLIE